jgi:riboflavin biosynthesis pyrimidine reductase
MRVTLFMAMSLNGIIARPNNDGDFITHQNWITFVQLCKEKGCVIWGRNTQEVRKGWEPQYFEDLKGVTKVVISEDENYDPGEGFLKEKSPKDALQKLTELGFSEVLLSGGSTLNNSFAKEGLINEVIINIEPIIVGTGIPLFRPDVFDLKLEFSSVEHHEKIIMLKYLVHG